jgi:hypothetical protein
MKEMSENMLLDIIHDRNEIRKEFLNWQHVVDDQIVELYNYKLRLLIAENTIKTLIDRREYDI